MRSILIDTTINTLVRLGAVASIITDMRGINAATGLAWTSAEIDAQLAVLAAITPAISGYTIYVGDAGRTSASDADKVTLVTNGNDVIEPGVAFDELAPSDLALTVIDDVQVDLTWTVNSENATGTRIYISTDDITYIEKDTVLGATAAYSATGLIEDTQYYFKAVAYYELQESAYSGTVNGLTYINVPLISTGDGSGVSTLSVIVSATQTFKLTESAKFYSDAAATLDESTTWEVIDTLTRTRYIKIPTGSAKLLIQRSITSIVAWTSSTNAASINGFNLSSLSNTAVSKLDIKGLNTVTGALSSLPSVINYLVCRGLNTIGGDLADSDGITNLQLQGENTISSYTSKTWNTKPVTIYIVGLATIPTADVDQFYIDMEAQFSWTSGNLSLLGNCEAPSAASLTARNSLTSQGVTVATN